MSGLAVGWGLTELGHQVEILESTDKVGGMAKSFHYDGAILDLGTHGLHASKQENEKIMKKIEALLGEEMVRVTRKASIYFRGKRVSSPLTPKEIFFGLEPLLAFSCGLDFLRTRVKHRFRLSKMKDENFKTWICNRFGEKLYNIYFGPYTQRVWGFDPSLLSSRWATTRIPLISLWDTVMKALMKSVSEKEGKLHSHSPYRKYFYYTRSGSGRIPDKIAEEIVTRGGRIHLGTEVSEIMIKNNRVASVKALRGNTEMVCEGDIVVSTLPINEMVGYLRPSPPLDVVKAAKGLRFRAMQLLYLIVNRKHVSDDQWVYFSDDGVLFNRFSEFKNCCQQIIDENRTALCLEITCFGGIHYGTCLPRRYFQSASLC